MSVWLTIPSARPPEEAEKCLKLWRERGYKIALWRDSGTSSPASVDLACDGLCGIGGGGYPGYAVSVNHLVDVVMKTDQDAEWFVIGGDDVQPDPNHSAEEIADECRTYFERLSSDIAVDILQDGTAGLDKRLSTFGVMQPTGDRWGESPNHVRPDMRSAYIDRVAGSAWLGREFCKRAYGGKGPLWPEYKHMWVDQELRDVAVKLGLYWERRDLTHHHAHAGRVPNYTSAMIPPHLKKWTVGEEGGKHWRESEALYFSRRDRGFPGHEPCV